MKQASVEAILRVLHKADVRYLVVGGLAVNAHGYLRFTYDVDFVVQLVPENIMKAFSALSSLGYKPRLPVTAEQFANPEIRADWTQNRNMVVMQLWSDEAPETNIDILVQEPFVFEDEYSQALVKPLESGEDVHFVSIPTLIRMKQIAGRDKDKIDIGYLRKIMLNKEKP